MRKRKLEKMKWFSDEQLTKEEAQKQHQPGIFIFDPAFVAQTIDNQFVMGLFCQSEQWPPEWINDFENIINKKYGMTIVSLYDPLLGVWKDVK